MKRVIKIVVLAAIALGVLSLLPLNTAKMYSKSADQKIITLTKNNVIILNSEIDGASVSSTINKAKDLDQGGVTSMGRRLNKIFGKNSGKDPIYLFLSTPGGDVQAGLELIEALHGMNRPVNTITSFAASMGFQLVQNLGERYILSAGVLMSHHATGGTEGEMGGKGKAQAESRLSFWERRINEMDQQTVDRSNGKQTLQSYQEAYDHELWLTGSEGVKQGYADQVVLLRCDSSLDSFTTHTVNFMGLVNIDYDISDCPLNSAPQNVRVHVETNKGTMTLGEFIQKDGGFGVICLQNAVLDNQKVCAVDTKLSMEKLEALKAKFLDKLINLKDHVVPMVLR